MVYGVKGSRQVKQCQWLVTFTASIDARISLSISRDKSFCLAFGMNLMELLLALTGVLSDELGMN